MAAILRVAERAYLDSLAAGIDGHPVEVITPDDCPMRLDYRKRDYRQLPRGSGRTAVLHFDPRRAQGSRRYRTQDRQLGLSDPAPGRRVAGSGGQHGRLRHAGRHPVADPQG